MYIVLFSSILAFLLTLLDSKSIIKGGMKYGFFLLTFLACIHYDYGNDYLAYLGIYNDIVKFPFNLQSVLEGEVYKEIGWTFLCYLFEYLGGFFMMVAVLNIIQNVLIYKIIKKYVEKRWWSMSVFLYVFYTAFYLTNFSMLRQGFVVCVFLGVWRMIEQKECIKALIVLYLCSLVHTSAIVLLPFAFLGLISIRRSDIWAICCIIFYFAVWFGGSFINNIFSSFMVIEEFSDYANTYSDYSASNKKISYGIGFLINQIPFILSLYYLFKNNSDDLQVEKKIVLISMLGFVIIPFASLIPMIGRLGMYFAVYQILAVPIIYNNIRNKYLSSGLLFVLILMTMYDYFKFFSSPIWTEKYSTFKTIFTQIF